MDRASWPGVALVLMSDVGFWLMGKLRELASGEEPDPEPTVSFCDCPRPPVTLAEAVNLARTERQLQGLPAGEQALADAFGVTRHQVRQLLTQTVEPIPGVPPLTDTDVPGGLLNGHPHNTVSA